MSEKKTYTLPKTERLCSKKLIDQLFLSRPFSKKSWIVKGVYQVCRRQGMQDEPVEVMMSVSKRQFKRAVKRNLVKRQMREAYRLHKSLLHDVVQKNPEAKLLVAFLWQDDQIHTSDEVSKAIQNVMRKMAGDVEQKLGDRVQ